MKLRIIFFILPAYIILTMALAGCDDRMYKPEPPERVESVTVSPEFSDGYQLNIGEELEVGWTVIVVPATATNRVEEFSSSDPSVATVDESGLVTALSIGTTQITITVDGKSDSFTLTVIPRQAIDVTDITVREDEIELPLDDELFDLMPYIILMPFNATYMDVTFESRDTEIAAVNERGMVSTVDVGETVITITSNFDSSVQAEITVTVVYNDPDYVIEDNEVKAYIGSGGYIRIPAWATSIAAGVFKDNTSITGVDLGNVTSVGVEAFSGCSNMTEFIAAHLTTIPNANVFEGTGSLKKVELLSLVRIDGKLLNGASSIEELIIPKVTYIDHDNLQNLTSLTTVDLSSVTEIGRDVFRSATSMTSIDLPASLTTIHGGFCSGAHSLTEINVDPANKVYKSVDGIVYTVDDTQIIAFPSGITGSFKVPDGVTVAKRGVFAFSKLSSLDLNHVVETDAYALYYMKELTECKAEALRRIGDATFRDVTELRFIALPSAVEILSNPFRGINNITIDFSGATGLTRVDSIPDEAGITIYVATEQIKTLFQGNNYTVIVGSPS